nr:hypothetical protein [Tanacetum cinerariifolium]
MRERGCATWDGGNSTWRGQARVISTVLVCESTGEGVWGRVDFGGKRCWGVLCELLGFKGLASLVPEVCLDSDFNVIRTQILATKPIPTLGTAYHMVAEDEKQRAISLENQAVPEATSFKAFQRRCFKLVGYPDWWPGKKDDKAKPKAAYVETGTSPIPGLNEGQYQEFVNFFSRSSNNIKEKPEANMAGNKDDVWVVDSGCTEYITHKSNLLENKKGTSNEAPVVIPNGHEILVEGKGDFILPGGAKINGGLRTRSLIGSG